jgi:hypothetical protein
LLQAVTPHPTVCNGAVNELFMVALRKKSGWDWVEWFWGDIRPEVV